MTSTAHELLTPPFGYIAGQWVGADSGHTFPVTNPATGEVLAHVPRHGRAETRRAIAAASAAWPGWRTRTPTDRSAVLRRWAELARAHRDDLTELLVKEQGKPLTEAAGEISYAVSFLDWFAEEGRRAYGRTIPADDPANRMLVLHQPVGVGAAITPWNFPAAMITRKAAPALAAGCTLVLKPAEQTPLTAIALVRLASEAGVPDGVLNLVLGSAEDAPEIGRELTTHETVRKVSFTGSTAVGSLLMQQSATTIKSVSLELGGNAPFIVFADADLDEAVTGLITCKFRNTGQTCITANRVLVAQEIHDEFIRRFVERAAALRVGNGLDPGVEVGPLIDDSAVSKVERHITDAVAQGGKIALGGKRHELGGTFFQPTVITGGRREMIACQEETFGPVAVVLTFQDEAEAVAVANDTPYGLAAYFYTKDTERVWRVSEALETGIIGVNIGVISAASAPFGGVKMSGIGREGSSYGLDDWLETKYVCQALAAMPSA
jgi:succinate-semialdehyde dehydrogenase/glutarate-semialdehyde dehydrogenase